MQLLRFPVIVLIKQYLLGVLYNPYSTDYHAISITYRAFTFISSPAAGVQPAERSVQLQDPCQDLR